MKLTERKYSHESESFAIIKWLSEFILIAHDVERQFDLDSLYDNTDQQKHILFCWFDYDIIFTSLFCSD
jgi:hypothetical protein